jgi:hypothetical protein
MFEAPAAGFSKRWMFGESEPSMKSAEIRSLVMTFGTVCYDLSGSKCLIS